MCCFLLNIFQSYEERIILPPYDLMVRVYERRDELVVVGVQYEELPDWILLAVKISTV